MLKEGPLRAAQGADRSLQSGSFSFAETSVGIAVLSPSDGIADFIMTDVNPAFGQLMDRAPGHLSGRNVSELPEPAGGMLNTYSAQVYATGDSQRCYMTVEGGGRLECTLVKTGLSVQVICLPTYTAADAETGIERAAFQKQREELDITRKRLYIMNMIQEVLLDEELGHSKIAGSFLLKINELVPCNRIAFVRFDDQADRTLIEHRLIDGVIQENVEEGPAAQFFNVPPLIYGQELLENRLTPEAYAHMGNWNPYRFGYRSCIMLPLFSANQYLGVFLLFSVQPDFFTENYIYLLKDIARQLSVILLQKKLHRKTKEQSLERGKKIRELSLVQKNILELTDVGIIAFNASETIDIANPAFERMIGYEAEQLSGKQGAELFSDFSLNITTVAEESGETLSYKAIKDQLLKTGHFQGQGTLLTRQGDKLPVLMTATTMPDEHQRLRGFVVMLTNMSRMVAVENLLHERNRLLTAFFDSTAALHCVTNMKGYFVLLNPLWEKVLGYSVSELMAKPYMEFIHPDDVQRSLSAIEDFEQHNLFQNDTTFVNRYRHKYGGYRLIEWTSSISGNIVISSARDITDQHLMQRKLETINRRLQLATKASKQGIWEYNARRDRFVWDKRTCEIYGVSPERITKGFSFNDFYALIHEEDKPVLYNDFVTLGEVKNYTRILRIPLPDGRIRFVENYGLLLTDKQGKPVKATGVVADITARMQAEEALLESEQRFREIADNVDEAFFIFITNPFRFLYVNAAYERLWGWERETFYNDPRTLTGNIVDEDLPAVRAFYEQTLAGTEGRIEFRIKGASHTVQWVLMRIFIKRDEQGNPLRYIGLASDITSRKEKELVLHEALVREQDLNKLKSQFVSTASHEFRTPLMTMQSCIDLIKWYVDRPEASARDAILKQLRIMQDEIKSFSELLSDILTVGRIDAGKVAIHLAETDVVKLIGTVIATHFARRSDRREVDFLVRGTPCVMELDENLITHVLVNLLSNAFKFSAENPEVVADFQCDRQVIITVRDKGIGIPEADQPLLFQAFFRARNTTAIQGTGLGLVIARQFVDLHQGTLSVASKEKDGTTFTISLPRKTGVVS